MSGVIQIANSFVCPLSGHIFQDPVSTLDGFTFERSNIMLWFNAGFCHNPITGAELPSRVLIPNIALRHSINAFLAVHPEFIGHNDPRATTLMKDRFSPVGIDFSRFSTQSSPATGNGEQMTFSRDRALRGDAIELSDDFSHIRRTVGDVGVAWTRAACWLNTNGLSHMPGAVKPKICFQVSEKKLCSAGMMFGFAVESPAKQTRQTFDEFLECSAFRMDASGWWWHAYSGEPNTSSSWSPSDLRVNDVVVVLIDENMFLHVIVNGSTKVKLESRIPPRDKNGTPTVMFPFIAVPGEVRGVSLLGAETNALVGSKVHVLNAKSGYPQVQPGTLTPPPALAMAQMSAETTKAAAVNMFGPYVDQRRHDLAGTIAGYHHAPVDVLDAAAAAAGYGHAVKAMK